MLFRSEREQEWLKQADREKTASVNAKNKIDSATAQKRRLFAQRRDSSLSVGMIMEPVDDLEMRRRFRNYEI